MPQLSEYLFVDQKSLDSYIEQISSLEVEERSRSGKIGLSITGPNAELSASSKYRLKTTSEKIRELTDYLDENEMLGHTRPQEMYKYESRQEGMPAFFLENLRARKLILPLKLTEKIPGVKHLGVWISDPDKNALVPESETTWVSPASFLYLTEMHLDNGGFQTVYSGCSALQAIANATNGLPLIDLSNFQGEPLGRDNYLHPVEKLLGLGATLGDIRNIECLYRIRYLTDEQCANLDGKDYRLYDILGYPIYIAQQLR